MLWTPAHAATEKPAPSPLTIKNSVQVGPGYDSNVFKTFGGSEGGYLVRGLFKSQGTYRPLSSLRLGWDYQGGGKAYFDQAEKSALIQYVAIPIAWQPNRHVQFFLRPDFKLQDERGGVNAGYLDFNEDYYSTTTRLNVRFYLPHSILIEPVAEFTYFHFEPTEDFGFFREWGGVTVRKTVGSILDFGAQYTYGRQQFKSGDREDAKHEISAFVQYLRVPVVSARYTYEQTDSTQAQFSFHNHRITLLLSLPLVSKPGANEVKKSSNGNPALFALHLLGTLRLKNFPSVYDYTSEGIRYLLTGAEGEIFNSLVAKLSYHPFPKWAFEAKYTRHSNDFSTQASSFSRSLFYGGARFSF